MTRDRSLIARTVAGVVAMAVAAGCSGDAAPSSPSAAPAEATSTSIAAPTGTRSETPAASPATKIPKTFDATNFADSPTDVNPWLPLTPGLQTVSKGAVNVGTRRLQHIRVNTVTDVTKEIDGVRAVLVLDQDFDGGQLSEQAIDYLAEDEGGNVWYVGSYTEAYEGGRVPQRTGRLARGRERGRARVVHARRPEAGDPALPPDEHPRRRTDHGTGRRGRQQDVRPVQVLRRRPRRSRNRAARTSTGRPASAGS